jgi:hypothetical protein
MKDEAADGNFAQAFYMKEHKSFPDNVELNACMELYLQVTNFVTASDCFGCRGFVLAATPARWGSSSLQFKLLNIICRALIEVCG